MKERPDQADDQDCAEVARKPMKPSLVVGHQLERSAQPVQNAADPIQFGAWLQVSGHHQ
jgi:hypothetical protein